MIITAHDVERLALEEAAFKPAADALAAFEAFDFAQAQREGWGFFNRAAVNGVFVRCECLDHQNHPGVKLPSDPAAWTLLAGRAEAGSQYHIDALAILKGVNPIEHWRITDYTED